MSKSVLEKAKIVRDWLHNQRGTLGEFYVKHNGYQVLIGRCDRKGFDMPTINHLLDLLLEKNLSARIIQNHGQVTVNVIQK